MNQRKLEKLQRTLIAFFLQSDLSFKEIHELTGSPSNKLGLSPDFCELLQNALIQVQSIISSNPTDFKITKSDRLTHILEVIRRRRLPKDEVYFLMISIWSEFKISESIEKLSMRKLVESFSMMVNRVEFELFLDKVEMREKNSEDPYLRGITKKE